MIEIPEVTIAGKRVLPIVEGGKGIAVSNGHTAGAFASAGAVGTVSGICADILSAAGEIVPYRIEAKDRPTRHRELVSESIKGGIDQINLAYSKSEGRGGLLLNILWEMGSSQEIMSGILSSVKGKLDGVVCGAGMPFKLAEITSSFGIYYLPIVSSARAFKALWARGYKKYPEYLGGVVYEDPWFAGGHDGMSNSDNPLFPQSPYEKVVEIRALMREVGISDEVPIIMAGGVWSLKDFASWIGDKKIGSIAFQIGTRPLLTQESVTSKTWYKRLMSLKKEDIIGQYLSPTGFYSRAIKNDFIDKILSRNSTEISYKEEPEEGFSYRISEGIYISEADKDRADSYKESGRTIIIKTPDFSILFITPEEQEEIKEDLKRCKGCLSQCRFSTWSQHSSTGSTGKLPDPRTFCIQKALDEAVHRDPEKGVMFSGSNGYRFREDSYYSGGFIPTISELVRDFLAGK